MKKINLFKKEIQIGILLIFSISPMFCQVGIGNQDPKATLHISAKPTDASAVDGVIFPNLTGNELKAKDGIYGPSQTGVLVYVTAAASPTTTKTAKVTEAGYYYFDGSVWVKNLSLVNVSYKTIAAAYPTIPTKGDKMFTTSDGTSTGTKYRIEIYDGTSWVNDNGVYPYIVTLDYTAGDIVNKDGVLYEANGNISTNTAFETGTTGATWKILDKISLIANNVAGVNLVSGNLVFIDPQYGVYENPAKLLSGSASSYFNTEKRVGTLQGDNTLNIGVNQPFNFFDKGIAIIKGVSDFTDNTNVVRGFNQGEEVWYRPFEIEKFSNNKGTLGNAIRLGVCSSNGGSTAALGINFDPIFVYKQSDVASSYKPILNNNATIPGATKIGRSIVGSTGLTGVFVGQANNYVDFDGTNYIFTQPNAEDQVILVDNIANIGQVYKFNGTTWNFLSKTTPLATDNYNASKNYQQNDLVIRNNKIYQANDYVAGGTAFAIGTTGATWKKISEISEWILTGVYETGDIVKKSGNLYEANANIPANTAFSVGTTGATWLSLSTTVPNWIDGGQIVITGTTSNPALPTTTTVNKVRYKQLGAKTWEVQGVIRYPNNTGAVQGSGDYLITLPNNLQFDTSIETQNLFTDLIDSNSFKLFARCIPGSTSSLFRAANEGNCWSGIIPYSSTKFRLLLGVVTVGIKCWGSNWFQTTNNAEHEITFSFTFQSAN